MDSLEPQCSGHTTELYDDNDDACKDDGVDFGDFELSDGGIGDIDGDYGYDDGDLGDYCDYGGQDDGVYYDDGH